MAIHLSRSFLAVAVTLVVLWGGSPVLYGQSEEAIQGFINEAIKAGGGNVVIPPGVHVIEKGLVLQDARNVKLTGLDRERSILKLAPSAKGSLITIQGASENVLIESLTLDGGAQVENEGPSKGDLLVVEAGQGENGSLVPVTGVALSRCILQNGARHGVVFRGVLGSVIESSTLMDLQGTALVFGEGTKKCAARHNHVTRALLGVELRQAQECQVRGNDFRSCGTGVTMEDGEAPEQTEGRHLILGNLFAKIAGDGIRTSPGTAGSIIEDNEFEGAGGRSLRLRGGEHTLKNNRL